MKRLIYPSSWRTCFDNARYGKKKDRNQDCGGEGGIRTPDTLSGMAAFEAARFNRSRTSPRQKPAAICLGGRTLFHSSSQPVLSCSLSSFIKDEKTKMGRQPAAVSESG